jgi:hypothetical protein
MTVSNLEVGKTVIFEKTAPGSYLDTNVLYRVESVSKFEVYFRNVKTGGASADSKSLLKFAQFYEATC